MKELFLDKFARLKSVCDVKEAREKIDEFISVVYNAFNKINRNAGYKKNNEFFSPYLTDFNNLVAQLCGEYSLNEKDIKLYFHMDKSIAPFMARSVLMGDIEDINVCDNNFKGATVHRLYLDDGYCTIAEGHCELFPESTKKYLLKKKEERETATFDKLSNEFQSKIFISRFDDKFRVGKFRTAIAKFYKKCSFDEYTTTLYHLHNAILNKYSGCEGKEKELMINFLVELAHGIFRDDFWFIQFMDNTSIEKMKPYINNQDICNSFARAVASSNNQSRLVFFAYFIANGEAKEVAERSLVQALIEESSSNYLNFKSIPKALHGELIEVAKKQFLKNHRNVKTFLIENGKIEDTSKKKKKF